MAKRQLPKRTFGSGELAPEFGMRRENDFYADGAKRMRNIRAIDSGSFERRPGTRYNSTVTTGGIIVTFFFNNQQAYNLHFYAGVMNAYFDDGTSASGVTGGPWTIDMLPELRWHQEGDVIFLCHRDMPTQVLRRTGVSSWTLSAYVFATATNLSYQPYYKFAADDVALFSPTTTGTAVVTASAPIFSAAYVGVRLRIRTTECTVTTYTNPTTVSVTIHGTLAATPATFDWKEQLSGPKNGYFGCVSIHRNRLVFSDHKTLPDALCLSVIGQYYNFSLGTGLANESIFEFIGDGRISRVRDLVSSETLLIFTDYGTYYVPERSDPPFTPAAFSIRAIDTVQAGISRAFRSERNIYIADINGKRLSEIYPTGDSSTPWASRNAGLLSNHLIRTPVSTAQAERFLNYPERYGFMVNADGTMVVLHSIQDQEVFGLTLWETNGLIKSVGAVGNNVFIHVQRTINGATVFTIEKLDATVFVDCAVQIPNITTAAPFYANQSVRVTGGGYDFGDRTPNGSGVFSLITPYAGPFLLGFFYAPDVELLTPEISGDGIATVAAKIKRISKAYIHHIGSGRFSVNDIFNLAYLPGESTASPPPLRTGIRQVGLLGHSREPTVRITQEDAVPLLVTGVSMEVVY